MTDQEPRGQRIGERVPAGLDDPSGGGTLLAYVPPPLPLNPPLDRGAYAATLAEAVGALERAEAAQEISLPGSKLLRLACIWRECVFSSQIEGTFSSFSDLVRHERGDPTLLNEPLSKDRRRDLQETRNCARALEHGLEQMRSEKGLPLSLRLLRDVHAILMRGVRGDSAAPGEVRRAPVYIGEKRADGKAKSVSFTPPPADRLDGLLGNLEEQFHADAPKGLLLEQAAVLHGQFEMIHPFLDGNGRVGRILIPLFLCAREPGRDVPPLVSMHLKIRHMEYYARLRDLSDGAHAGDAWERWIDFFLKAVRDTCDYASSLAGRLREMFEQQDASLRKARILMQAPGFVCSQLRESFSASAGDIAKGTGLSTAAVYGALAELEKMGIAEEVTKRSRNRAWVLPEQLQLLNEHTDQPFA